LVLILDVRTLLPPVVEENTFEQILVSLLTLFFLSLGANRDMNMTYTAGQDSNT
jgi:hypothetical protein